MSRPYLEDFAIERYRKGGSTRYFSVGYGATAGGALALVANTLYAFPFFVPATRKFDRIAINVTVKGTAASARLGVYADDGSVAPRRLVLDAGTVDMTTVGVKQITISLTLQGGELYWLVIVCNVAATLRSIVVGALYCVFFGLDSTLGTAWGTMMSRSFTYAALPDPWGTPTIGTAAIQGIYLRAV